jgi:ferric-dicitrate binding protein FerR (iron transport regulator)
MAEPEVRAVRFHPIDYAAASLVIELDTVPTPELVAKIEQWKSKDPRHREAFDAIQRIWDEFAILNTRRRARH